MSKSLLAMKPLHKQEVHHLLLSSNNNPKVIVNYYLCCIKELKLIPRVVIGVRGTENVIVRGIQRFFHRNHTDSQSKERSFVYGHSKPTYKILVVSVIQKYDILVDYLFQGHGCQWLV